jgi:hypothetical protein
MEILLNSIRELSVNRSSVHDIISKLENVSGLGKRKQDVEWEELENNYRKLLYLDELIVELSNEELNPLVIPLSEFLQKLDSKTQYYISEIDWWNKDTDIYDETKNIGDTLVQTLNINEPFEKLAVLLDAYSKVIDILGEYGRYFMSTEFDDSEFKTTFSKKQRN